MKTLAHTTSKGPAVNRHAVVGVFVAAWVLTAGCTDAARATGASAPAEAAAAMPVAGPPAVAAMPEPPSAMLALLPEGTAMFAYVPALARLQDGVRRVMATVDPEAATNYDILGIAATLSGVDLAGGDRSQGSLLALVPPPAADPWGITVIAPSADPEAVATDVRARGHGLTADAAGGFIALTADTPYRRGGMPGWASARLPEGDLVLRLDAPRVARLLREKLARVSAALGVPEAALKPLADQLVAAMDASTTWDLALRIDGTRVDLSALVRLAGGGEATGRPKGSRTDLAALARGLAGDGELAAAMATDMRDTVAPALNALTQALRMFPVGQQWLPARTPDEAGRAGRNWGPANCLTIARAHGGWQAVAVGETADAAALKRAAIAFCARPGAEGGSLRFAPCETRAVDGVRVLRTRGEVIAHKLPMHRMTDETAAEQRAGVLELIGKGGLIIDLATVGNRALLVFGGDAATAHALQAIKSTAPATPAALSAALAAAGPDTVGYLRVDLRALARGLVSLMPSSGAAESGPAPRNADGTALPLTLVVTAPPGELRFSLSLDVGQTLAMLKSEMPR